MTAITMATYQQVVAALLKGTEVVIQAKHEWNGFVPDVKYPLSIAGGRVSAVDQHGLTSTIDPMDAAEYFSLVTVLTPEDAAPVVAFHVRLSALCAGLTDEQHDFKVGDLAVWKDGLSNRNQPAYSEPVVVTKVYAVPIRDNKMGAENAYFDEPLSMKIGQISEYGGDDKFFEITVDGRRFRLYDPAIDGEFLPEQKGLLYQLMGRGNRIQPEGL